MSDKTSIEWTATIQPDGTVTPGATWNPIKSRRKDNGKIGWHCERVSTGCTNCYSAAMNRRKLNVGTGLDYVRSSRDQVDIIIDEKTLLAPLKWRKPRKIFVCSMTDLFAEFVPFEFVDRVFAVMALCPQHTFQCLTKRPERMAEYFASRSGVMNLHWIVGPGISTHDEVEDWCMANGITRNERERRRHISHYHYFPGECRVPPWPLPHAWLGTSVENQEWADKRIPHLLECPAAVRFLSVEPLLGPIDLAMAVPCGDCGEYGDQSGCRFGGECIDENWWAKAGIHWVIVGGESGRNARPVHPDWVRGIRDQCQAAGVPLHFKQWGAHVPLEDIGDPGRCSTLRIDTSGRDLTGLYGLHDDSDAVMAQVGKKAAGRLLDGREWNEFPQSVAAE